MELTISRKELHRREEAFTALLLSTGISLFVFSSLLNFSMSPVVVSIIIIVLCLVWGTTFKFLRALSRLKIIIFDKEIVRQVGKNIEKYPIAEIDSIKIKRRTNGVIREIYISFSNHKQLYISAFEEQFESLINTLVSKADKKLIIKETREPLNFDHILFYPILGLLVGGTSVCIFAQLLKADYTTAKAFYFGTFIYTLCLSIYFFVKKPISVRSGKNQIFTDYIFGSSILLASILVLLIGIQM